MASEMKWSLLLIFVFPVLFVHGQVEYDVRLVGGTSSSSGRVEIFYNNDWRTVCSTGWSSANSEIVCYQLGYGSENALSRLNGYYGGGSGSTLRVSCSSLDTRLRDCYFSTTSYCSSYDTAGVQCGSFYTTTLYPYPWNTDFDSIRLVDGSSPSEGRVEVYYNGEWGTVCDDSWGNSDAQVVCRQLGYSTSGARALQGAYFGQGSGPILRYNFHCSGYEWQLTSCSFSRSSYCDHSEDAGVRCAPSTASVVIGMMSFVGISCFILIIIATVAVCYTCSKGNQNTPGSGSPQEMQLSSVGVTPNINTNPAMTPGQPGAGIQFLNPQPAPTQNNSFPPPYAPSAQGNSPPEATQEGASHPIPGPDNSPSDPSGSPDFAENTRSPKPDGGPKSLEIDRATSGPLSADVENSYQELGPREEDESYQELHTLR